MANGDFDRRAALADRAPKPGGMPASQGAPNPLLDIVQILEGVGPSLPPQQQQLVQQAADLLRQAAEARPQGGPGNAPSAETEGEPSPL